MSLKTSLAMGLLSISLLSVAGSSMGWAGIEPEGKSPSRYETKLQEQEIRELITQIESISSMGADEERVHKLLNHPQDHQAYQFFTERVALRFEWAAYELRELKNVVLDYAVIASAGLEPKVLRPFAEVYTQSAQNRYERAIWSLAAVSTDLDQSLTRCMTPVCIQNLKHSAQELLEFARESNRDLDFENISSKVEIFFKVEDPLLKTSLRKTFKKLVPDNEDHNLWKVAASGILAPLVFAGEAIASVGEAAGSVVFNPRWMKILLSVDEVDVDYRALSDDFLSKADTHGQALARLLTSRVSFEQLQILTRSQLGAFLRREENLGACEVRFAARVTGSSGLNNIYEIRNQGKRLIQIEVMDGSDETSIFVHTLFLNSQVREECFRQY